MSKLRPEDLLRIYPEIDFLVAEGTASSRYMIAIHEAFYDFAAGRLDGGTVLDAGCGTGFGTSILARRAERAVGIDLKDKLLEYARQEYDRPGLEFRVMDAVDLAFDDGSFDAVVADELLEHLPAHRPFLDEAVRVLRPGGTFVCATVNRVHSFGQSADDPLNRNHFREYDAADFREELERWFVDVEILGQGMGGGFDRYVNNRSARGIEWLLLQLNVKHRIPAAWRAKIRSWLTGVDAQKIDSGSFSVGDRDVEDAVYLVAVARKAGGR